MSSRLKRTLLLTALAVTAAATFILPRVVDSSPVPGLGRKHIDLAVVRAGAAAQRGHDEAVALLRRGRLRILKYGPASPAFVSLVKARYGVELEASSSFCGLTTLEDGAYTDSFNAVMRKAVIERYRSDRFPDCRRETEPTPCPR